MKIMNFGDFTIQVPSAWSEVKIQGIDSYVGAIAIDQTDTIHFDLGWYSSKLEDEEPVIIIESTKKYFSQEVLSQPNVHIVPDKDSMLSKELFIKTLTSTQRVDGYVAKLVKPKKSGSGTTGIYIDSLWQAGSDVDRFQISGNDLKPENEKVFLTVINSIKFKPRKPQKAETIFVK